MDEKLEILFKKTRESLSEPVPISEIRSKINASPEPQSIKNRFPRRFQVLLGIALLLVAIYVFIDFGAGDKDSSTDNETAQQEEALNQEEESPTQEKALTQEETVKPDETTERADIGMRETTDDANLPSQDDTAPNDQDRDPSNPIDQPPLDIDDPTESTGPTDTGSPDEDDNTGTVTVDKPKDDVSTAPPLPILQDKSTKPGFHRFEIPSNATRKDLKKLDKKLSQYGLTLKITTLEYDGEWISKFKGGLVALNYNIKSSFNVKTSDFQRVVLTFEYTKSGGPRKTEAWPEQ